MNTKIDSTPRGLIISSYQKDIERLNKMARIYETIDNLNGGFYADMTAEIQLQIEHCKNCIKNLQELEGA